MLCAKVLTVAHFFTALQQTFMSSNIRLPAGCPCGPPGCNDEAIAIPMGGLAQGTDGPLLPHHLGVRGYVCGSALVLWVLQGYELTQPVDQLSLQYALPRQAEQPPPPYQPALLYPPRSLVQHEGIAYQNLTADDLGTPPPRHWTPVPMPHPAPVLQCTSAVALRLRDGTASVCSPPLPPCSEVPAGSRACRPECLLTSTADDEVYVQAAQGLQPGDAVMALWQLQVPLASHAILMVPSMLHRCRTSVRLPCAATSMPAVDRAGLVQPIERIQSNGQQLWWYPELGHYRNAAGTCAALSAVAQQLGKETYHVTRVVMAEGGLWTHEATASVRTEVYVGLPPPRLPRLELRLPFDLVLLQLPVPQPPPDGRFLLLSHGHVLAASQVPARHDRRHTEDWYSWADRQERLAWQGEPEGVLWVAHRPHDPAPRVVWIPEDTWTAEEDWECEDFCETVTCPTEAQLVAELRQAQTHRQEMLCRMWEEAQCETNALLLLLCSQDTELPWQMRSAQLLQQWPHMTDISTDALLLQRVHQTLQRLSGNLACPQQTVARTGLRAPHALPAVSQSSTWSGGRLATTARQGTGLAALRRSPWVRHLGSSYNRLHQLLLTASPAAADRQQHHDLHVDG